MLDMLTEQSITHKKDRETHPLDKKSVLTLLDYYPNQTTRML